MRLDGKSAIVTGAGSGFGEGIARRFAEEGAKVLAVDLDAASAARVAEEIRAAGGTASACTADVSIDAQVAAMVAAALDQHDGLDIIVNNAGTTHKNSPMTEIDEATFERVFAVNVKSIYLSAMHAVPVFRQRGGGAFVNIASTAGVRPRPGLVWYNASKGAVINMTKGMAVELAPDRIRVNAVNPVVSATGLLHLFLPGEDTPDTRQKFVDTIPMGRMSTPLDVANASLYLSSDEAEFITGVCIEVDGGRCI